MGNNPVTGVDPDGTIFVIVPYQQHFQQGYVNGEPVGDAIPGEIDYMLVDLNMTSGGYRYPIYNSFPNGRGGGGGHGGCGNNNNGGSNGGNWGLEGPNINANYITTKEDVENYAIVALALLFRYSPIIGFSINPLFIAEAIMIDGGVTVAGTEYDGGGILILAGEDAGKFVPFDEYAGGVGSDAGVSVEVTRVDYFGDLDNFNSTAIEGSRDKIYAGVELTGEGFSAGLAYNWSYPLNGGYLQGISIQAGFGASVIPFIYGGYNNGIIRIRPINP
jgi:hypothetical protein